MQRPGELPQPGGQFVPGKILVRFKDGTSDEMIASVLQAYGLKLLNKASKRRTCVVEVPVGEENAWIAKFGAMLIVKAAGREMILRACKPKS